VETQIGAPGSPYSQLALKAIDVGTGNSSFSITGALTSMNMWVIDGTSTTDGLHVT